MIAGIILVLLFVKIAYYSVLTQDGYIYPGTIWYDTDGNSIQAHAVGMLVDPFDGTFWWYGESLKTDNLSDHGVNLYHSKDLSTWVNYGQVLGQKQVYIENLTGPYIIERPKVIWNPVTKLFVMWFHLDGDDYRYRYVGVATSPQPNATFTFIHGFQPDGIPSLDMNVYQDKRNGTIQGAYLIRSCNNRFVGVSKLTDDYLNTTGITSAIGKAREGHAVFYREGHYYMMTSHLTGWGTNPAELFMTSLDSLDHASWFSLGNPTNSSNTWNSQSSFVLEVPSTKNPGTSVFVYMGDRWLNPHLINATYVWLPYHFYSPANLSLPWYDRWRLSDF